MARQSVTHVPPAVPPDMPPAGAAPAPAPADDSDLDARIGRVEQRLVVREQRLLTQVQGLGARARQAAAPRASLLKLAGVAAAGAVLVWALRRGGGRNVPQRQRSPVARAGVGGPPRLLLSLLPMAWPLLPARWRDRASPATAATVLGLALPLVQCLVARRTAAGTSSGDRRAPTPVVHLDLARHAGASHAQARLPQPSEAFCAGQPCATDTPQGALPCWPTARPRGGHAAAAVVQASSG